MNNNHYPSLELCKNLTDIGFPKTGISHAQVFPESFHKGDKLLVCPSVMEMLDVIYIPLHYRISIDKMFDIDDGVWYRVSFYSSEHFNDLIRGFQGNLPNALAEMILWLHENNYISFSK